MARYRTIPILVLLCIASFGPLPDSSAVPLLAPSSRFLGARTFDVGEPAYSVAVADFNGDHKADVAGLDSIRGVDISFGNGDGTFESPVPYPAPFPTEVAEADFDRDGSPDLATTQSLNDGTTVSILLNRGDGTFAPAVEYPAGAPTYAVATGDFDGDGAPDLVIGGAGGKRGGVFVLMNNGDGTFLPPMGYGMGWRDAVAVGDFNGDHRPDIAAAKSTKTSVDILLNQGQGTFGPVTTYPARGYPGYLIAADLTSGGPPDLAFIDRATQAVGVLRNEGYGTFRPAGSYPARLPNSVVATDLNGDNLEDLAVSESEGTVSIHLNKGEWNFGPALTFGAGAAAWFVAAGDVNADANPDLVVANGAAGIAVLLGKGNGRLVSAPFFRAKDPVALAAGNFNGDRKLDLAVLGNSGFGSGRVTVLLGTGSDHFVRAGVIPLGPTPVSEASGDFNLDGNLDLAVGDGSKGQMTILSGHGDGTFGSLTSVSLPGYPAGVVARDFNRDGKPDLAVALSSDLMVQATILLGRGDGTFEAPATYQGGVGLTSGMAMSDLNGDGHQDLALVGSDPLGGRQSTLSVFLCARDGFFRQAKVSSLPVYSAGVAAADLNHDGMPDLAIADEYGGVAVLLGAGDGTFGPQTSVDAGGLPLGIAIGDTNGDGNRDLVVATYNGFVSILAGEGDGTFDAPVSYANGSGSSRATPQIVALGIFDGRPGKDIAVGQYDADSVAILSQLPPA
jgi:hypothetical protein